VFVLLLRYSAVLGLGHDSALKIVLEVIALLLDRIDVLVHEPNELFAQRLHLGGIFEVHL
jgi:hypothetical protein